MPESVKLINAALDEEGSDIILRGGIDPDTLRHLLTADYQREVLPLTSLSRLIKAFESGDSVPDIELGMRGQRYSDRQSGVFLLDSVYIVDGLQRVTAALQVLHKGKVRPRLGATVHFSTTEEWERKRFQILNANRTKLSPNVLLRNLRHDSASIEVLYQLTTTDKTFVLRGRVSWSQRMKRQDLLTALSFAQAVGTLHAHAGPGLYRKVNELAGGLDRIMENVTLNVFLANARAFFDLIDQSWGIRRVAYKEGASHLRTTFMAALASVLSRHTDFWRDERLFIEAPLARKIALFPVTDPQIANLSSSAGKARDMLYYLMLEHINSGKRTKRLTLRDGIPPEEVPALHDNGDYQTEDE